MMEELPGTTPSLSGTGDVDCDFCTGQKSKAAKSCLTCLASFCEIHVQLHFEGAVWQHHELVNPVGDLRQKLCAKHHKCLEVFCRTDRVCICCLCAATDHKNHVTVELELERSEQQKRLDESLLEIKKEIVKRQKELEAMEFSINLIKSAERDMKECKDAFHALLCSIEEANRKVMEQIRELEKQELRRAKEAMKQLEKEIEELKRRDAELTKLSETDDHIHFLQACSVYQMQPKDKDPLHFIAFTDFFSTSMEKAIYNVKERIEKICQQGREQNPVPASFMHQPFPQTREEFLECSCSLSLDPNTANKFLYLSDGNRRMTLVHTSQPYPDHPERFDWWSQVLCTQGLFRSCFYWEVQWTGNKAVIGVTYRGINRKEKCDTCILGQNAKSWSLRCSDSGFSAQHNKKETKITAHPCHRIGVYLDCLAGSLSFYSVSDTMTHLYSFRNTFKEPLYPGFWVYSHKSSITICQLKQSSLS
ncbi:tripartite motif-containing protein 16-like isoform X2 [Polypterus senegalus]|uniref:tripartite motif-containing protein 16-like isoform X2 n=1 Tax=Polypterus senegalus TaxID=55291 RepID=UPI00196267C6|nr:tripartite motif-containing protein 16-like isoform X2 [Polypterus senegalus]